MNIVKKRTADLVPYKRNTKIHDRRQILNVAESIRQYGFVQPIVIDKNNVVVIGHCRLAAALELQMDEVPCVCVDDLTPKQVKALRIVDNKTNESPWDFDILGGELAEIDLSAFDLDFGIDLEEESHEIVEDTPPEIDETKEPTVKPGQIWKLGRHRLMCGDSTDPLNIKLLMQGKKADLVFTDPPYGMKKEADGVANDNLNYDDLLEFNKQWIPISFDALKDNGSWYCWGIDEPLMDIYSHIIKPMTKLRGQEKVTFRNLITWDKGSGQGQMAAEHRCYARADEKCLFVMRGRQTYGETNADYWDGFEPIRQRLIGIKDRLGLSTAQVIEYAGATTCSHWFSTSQWEFPNEQRFTKFLDNLLNGGKITRQEFDEIRQEWYGTRAYFDNTHDNMNNVWHFTTLANGSQERKEAGGHATPKPIALCSRAIKSSSRECESVLDFFGGSGSTLIACEQLNRSAYLMELEPKWCDVIIKRWENLTGEKAVLISE
jgi:DNA modification methylase